ncbi:hypothetical protein [Streptomyces sp. URMC 125]
MPGQKAGGELHLVGVHPHSGVIDDDACSGVDLVQTDVDGQGAV